MSNEKEYAFVGTPDKSPRAQAIDKRERAIELARYWQKPVDQKECHSFVLMCISRQLLAEAKRVDELEAQLTWEIKQHQALKDAVAGRRGSGG